MKFTKKQRAEAIEILAICASQQGNPWNIHTFTIEEGPAEVLAASAWKQANTYCGLNDDFRIIFAEAECLLREGWSPS